MELIDKAAVAAEIEKRIKETESMQPKFDQFWAGQISAFKGVLKILDTLEVKEIETSKVTKHSYFETIYHCGTEPMWKVGDILAVYEFYSDREGEYVYGEVIGVKNDETHGDWIYTMRRDFGEYEVIYEKELISQEAYKKNK